MIKQIFRLGIPRLLRIAIILIFIFLLLVFLPAPNLMALAEIVPLPINEEGGVPPYSWGFQDNGGYQDESICVKMEEGRFEGSNWKAVSVRIKEPSQLRTLKAGKYGSTQVAPGATLARRVQAVLAIGGDYFVYHNEGYIVRQGQFYRNKPNGKSDVLIIDRQGDFHVLFKPGRKETDDFERLHRDEIVNAFTFGPVLIKDGRVVEDMTRSSIDKVLAQRIALCQTGPLSYLIVYCEGPNDENSLGMNIESFARLVASFPNVQTAYNLDGGSSATIVFQGEKINGPRAQRSRPIGDIIYFASAYVAEPAAGAEGAEEPPLETVQK